MNPPSNAFFRAYRRCQIQGKYRKVRRITEIVRAHDGGKRCVSLHRRCECIFALECAKCHTPVCTCKPILYLIVFEGGSKPVAADTKP